MIDPAVTTACARAFIDELARLGIKHVCVAPGSRSTPLVMACAMDDRFTTWVYLDERSAGFFALGIGKATRKPAAVITTSGTAVANLFPSVIEASRSNVPMLILTADRPLRLRGSDANQAIEQEGIYEPYTRYSIDIGDPDLEKLQQIRVHACRAVGRALGSNPGPVHVNFPFDKPLEPVEMDPDREKIIRDGDPLGLDGKDCGSPMELIVNPVIEDCKSDVIVSSLRDSKRGLIFAGPVVDPDSIGPALIDFSKSWGFPLIADPLSGARFGRDCESAVVAYAELFLRDPSIRKTLQPDVILRVGAPPTSPGILAFLEDCVDIPQIVIGSNPPQKDSISNKSQYFQVDVASILEKSKDSLSQEIPPSGWRDLWRHFDRISCETVRGIRGDFFEGDILSAVVDVIPEDGTLFVSNSMPVRDLDAFGGSGSKRIKIFGNRGASGIDGIVSTVAGIAAGISSQSVTMADQKSLPVVAVLGDIAFYHDMNGLLAIKHNLFNVLFVVINNDGGGIFHMLSIRDHEPEFTRYFATPHGLDFRHAANLYQIPYRLLDDCERLSEVLEECLLEPGPQILEIITDRVDNQRRHREVVEAVADVVRHELEVLKHTLS